LGPLIPYIKVGELPLDFLVHVPYLNRLFDVRHPPSIKPFGTLVALGVYVGSIVAARHARQRGLDDKKMSDVVFWVVGIGFIGGHVLDAIFYHPRHILQDPFYIIKLWDGLSSYGGFIGAIAGALLWQWRKKLPVLPYIECVNSAFPLAWVFGRSGCSTVHDHPGMLSDAWFAVQWPMPNGGVTGRLDLGLIEMVLTIPLAVSFLVLWRRKPVRPIGFYSGWMCVAYAPVRFLLDFLRETDANGGDLRYAFLTPAQWACFGLFAIGLYMLHRSRRPESLALATGPGWRGDAASTEASTSNEGTASTDGSSQEVAAPQEIAEAPASQRS
jgi:phosphatidylglycerol:prolipoprotein diacylglycerol transferase